MTNSANNIYHFKPETYADPYSTKASVLYSLSKGVVDSQSRKRKRVPNKPKEANPEIYEKPSDIDMAISRMASAITSKEDNRELEPPKLFKFNPPKYDWTYREKKIVVECHEKYNLCWEGISRHYLQSSKSAKQCRLMYQKYKKDPTILKPPSKKWTRSDKDVLRSAREIEGLGWESIAIKYFTGYKTASECKDYYEKNKKSFSKKPIPVIHMKVGEESLDLKTMAQNFYEKEPEPVPTSSFSHEIFKESSFYQDDIEFENPLFSLEENPADQTPLSPLF